MKDARGTELAALLAACFKLDPTRPKRKRKPSKDAPATSLAPLWDGWRCVGAELIDDAGNRYGMHEIRAIFYNRHLIRSLELKIQALQGPPESAQVQMAFDFMRELSPRNRNPR